MLMQKYRSTKVQKYKSTKVQEYKSLRVQEYKSTRVQKIQYLAAGRSCQRFDDYTGICLFCDIKCGMVVLVTPTRLIYSPTIHVLVRCVLIPEHSFI